MLKYFERTTLYCPSCLADESQNPGNSLVSRSCSLLRVSQIQLLRVSQIQLLRVSQILRLRRRFFEFLWFHPENRIFKISKMLQKKGVEKIPANVDYYLL